MAINWKQVQAAARRQDKQAVHGRTATGVPSAQDSGQISARSGLDWEAVQSNARLLDRQQAQSQQRKNAYEEAYERYKQAAATVQHDQQSGYRRTQELKWRQSTPYHDQLSGYRRTQQLKEGLRKASPEYQAAVKSVQRDQARGMKRTSEALGREIDDLELKIYDARLNQMDYQRQVEAGQAEDITGMLNRQQDLSERKSALDSQRALLTAQDRTGTLDAETRALLRQYNGGGNGMQALEARHRLRQMGYTDEQIGSLAEYEKYLQDFEDYQTRMAGAQQFGRDAPVPSTILSSLMAPFKALGNLESLRGVLPKGLGGYRNEDMPTNVYSPLYAASHVSGGIRSGVMENMGPVGQFLYQAGTSAMDSAVNMAVSTGLVGAATGLSGEAASAAIADTMNWVMGSQVAADSVYEGIRNGKSNERALIDGIVEGAIEGITEKYSVGDLIENMLNGEKAWKKIVRAFASEGAEEIASNWLNRLYDAVARRDRNELYGSYAQYLAQGMSERQALAAVLKDMAAEDVTSFLAGGLSGWAMSGTYALTNRAVEAYGKEEQLSAFGQFAEIAMQSGDEATRAAAQAVQEKVSQGAIPDAGEVQAVVEAAVAAENRANGTVQNSADDASSAPGAENGSRAAENEDAFRLYNQAADARDARQRSEAEQIEAELNAFEQEGVQNAPDVRARQQAEEARTEAQFDRESRDAADRALSEAAARYGYDERMTSVLLSGYDGAQDAEQYAQRVNTAYEYGKSGLSLTAARRAAEGIDAGLAQEAWNAGKEVFSGTEAGSKAADDGGKRNAGVDSGKQAGAVAEGAGGAKKRSAEAKRVQAGLELENRVRAAGQPYLSGKDIGLSKGSAQRSFREAPESVWTAEMKEAAGKLRDAGFTEVHFTVGSIGVENQRAKVTRYVDGAAVGDTVWVNATAKKWTAQQLADHEAFHRQLQDAPYLMDSVRAALVEELGEDGISELAARYAEAYEGCYDAEELDAYIEEICADAYAGMDRMPEEKTRIIQKAAKTAQEARPAAEKSGGTRGPPERYSVSEADSREQTQDEITAEYQNAVHGILNGTINAKDALLVGYTPEIYRKLGMPDLPFVVGSGHVYSIAKTQDEAKAEGRFRKNTNYHGLGERAVADILQVVQNPVMVISAKDVDRNTTPLRSTHSVVALVDVGTNGKSLVVPVSITAQSTVDGTVMDVNMISSVYEKNARGLVNEAIAQFNSGENSIFYVTEKAATLAGEGVQFPSILQAAATSSDGIVRKFDSKINMSIENVTQSKQFKRWFGDWQNKPETASKVVNEDGTPKIMYRGGNETFNIFDRKKSKYSNLYGRGFYFTDSESHAKQYGDVRSYYLNIRNPLPTQERTITRRQMQKFLEAVVENEDYGLENYGYDATVNSVLNSVYGKNDFAMLYDVNQTAIGDMVAAVELFNEVNGTSFDGLILDTETVAFNSNQIKSATDNVGTFDRDNPDIRYSVAESDTETDGTTAFTLDSIPKKAQDYLRRVRGQTAAAIQQTLSMPFAARQEVLKPAIEQMMNEYLQTGRISQETIDQTFDRSYARGVELDTEFYDQYKDVKTRLRDLKVTLSEADRADIADFNDFRRAAFGRLRIANEGGLPVDVAYNEMRQMAPELFPASITHPADQLMKMFEVSKRIEQVQRSLDEYHGENAEEFKRWAKNDYEASVENMLGSLRVARRYAEARMRQTQARAVPTTIEEVKSLYADLKKLRRTYERAASKNLLTAEDNNVLNRLLRGEIAPEDVQGMENAKGILAMYEAKADYDAAAAKIADWRRYQKSQKLATADRLLQNADKAKDKAAGIQYSRETMTRNVRDIFPEEDAERIIKTYFEPVRTASANANKLKNQLREQVKALDLSRKAKKGDAVSEAHAVQLLGEAQDNIRYLEQHPRAQDRDGKTLDEWRQIVSDLWVTSPGLGQVKIERAVDTFRQIYDSLFDQMNDVRIRNGYEPVNYRQGYFPHFQPGTSDGILNLMGKALGIDAEVTALPTTISGLTHTFRPGITYFGHALERIGFDTAYDAVEGFDKYVEGAASVICYTDVIQNLRALAEQVRYRTSDEGLRERVDDIRAREDLTETDKELRIKEVMEKGRYSLSNFAVELDEYTNLLANKKSKYDRSIEHLAGRKAYNLLKAWENRVAANMVAVNPASWLTNFGVITQAGAQLKTSSVLKAMAQTIQNYKTSDGLVAASDFLTNRRGSDPLVQSWQQRTSAVLSTPMELIDTFSADTIVRARYMENLERGMSEETAMREADNFAANVMADRSKGAMPTLFEARNPLMKMFTQFQLEVNNTFSYLFKDLPREQRKKGIGALAYALFKFLIGGYLYNEVYEYLIGRRPMLDPLGIVNDTVGDLTGYELNNLVDAATGGGLIKESEPEGAIGTIKNLAENAGQEAPFVGNLMGGGKLPFSSSMPDLGNIATALASETATDEEKLAKVGKEMVNPAAYWLLPFGGGQVKKVWQGINALKNQGSYTADGRLQYPIYSDREGDKANAAWRTLLFGKSATPEAQAWVEAGFGALSEKATQTYEAMRGAGVDQRDSYELIKAMSKVKKTDDASRKQLQMQLLLSFDIEDSGKGLYYYHMMASDEEKEKIDELLAGGADMIEYIRYMSENASGWSDLYQASRTNPASYTTLKQAAVASAVSGGKTQEEAESAISSALKSQLKEDYLSGAVPESEVSDYLQKYLGAEDEHDVYWTIEGWKGGKDWTKYGRFLDAAKAGVLADTRAIAKEYMKHGVEKSDLSSVLTNYYKDRWLKAEGDEAQKLKDAYISAYTAIGGSRNDAVDNMIKWRHDAREKARKKKGAAK